MSELVISLLEKKDIPEAARVLSIAMLENPIHVAVFQGKDEEARRRIEQIYYTCLQDYPEIVFIGKIDTQIVGVFRMYSCLSRQTYIEKEKTSGFSLLYRCSMNIGRKLMKVGRHCNWVGRKLLNSEVLKDKTSRVSHWHNVWLDHDPSEPHWHYGPGGVLPEFQGTGIGTAHMQRICQEIDACKAAGYLETDLIKNVHYYQKFDFEVIDETDIFGVKIYFMWRPPR